MTSDNLYSPDAFWRYSLTVYGREQVKHLCLTLQDEQQMNVNLILLCGWLAEFGKSLTAFQFKHIWQHLVPSDNTLHCHRQQRRQAKGTSQYDELLAQELKMEAAQQRSLLSFIKGVELSDTGSHPLLQYAAIINKNSVYDDCETLAVMMVLAHGRDKDSEGELDDRRL